MLVQVTAQAQTSAPTQALHFATEEFAPFTMEENGKATGPMVEVVLAVCAAAKFTCQIDVLPWRRAFALIEEGHIDAMFSILPTPEREKTFIFSAPIVQTGYSFFIANESNWQYKTPDDLSGMTLAAYGPSGSSITLAELVAQNQSARMEIELSNVSAFRKLAGGRFGAQAAVLANRDVGKALLKKEPFRGIKQAGNIKNIVYAIGFSRKKNNPAQFETFNHALLELKRNGKIRDILAKHQLDEAKLN